MYNRARKKIFLPKVTYVQMYMTYLCSLITTTTTKKKRFTLRACILFFIPKLSRIASINFNSPVYYMQHTFFLPSWKKNANFASLCNKLLLSFRKGCIFCESLYNSNRMRFFSFFSEILYPFEAFYPFRMTKGFYT